MCGEGGDTPNGAVARREPATEPVAGSPWHTLAASVPGASHQRSGMPNQDAVAAQALPQGGFIVCVSDGHGSARYFRSDVGSRLAVEVGITTLRAFVDRSEKEDDEQEKWARILEHEARDRLPRDIVLAWREAAMAHAVANPRPVEKTMGTSATDAQSTEAVNEDAPPQQVSEEAPLHAYGATFLAVAVCPRFILYMQLGDGDIVTLEQDVAAFALPRDPRLLANETTSLCGDDAWKDFRVRLDLFRSTQPDLILATTDGYANSFASDQDFLQVAGDLWAALRREGVEPVEQSLAEWLAESSRLGSGDDASVGLLFRMPVEPDLTPGEGSSKEEEVRT